MRSLLLTPQLVARRRTPASLRRTCGRPERGSGAGAAAARPARLSAAASRPRQDRREAGPCRRRLGSDERRLAVRRVGLQRVDGTVPRVRHDEEVARPVEGEVHRPQGASATVSSGARPPTSGGSAASVRRRRGSRRSERRPTGDVVEAAARRATVAPGSSTGDGATAAGAGGRPDTSSQANSRWRRPTPDPSSNTVVSYETLLLL